MGMQQSCYYCSHCTDEEFCQGSKKFNDLLKITELLNETEKETESRSVRLQSPVLSATPSGLAGAAVLLGPGSPAPLNAEGKEDSILQLMSRSKPSMILPLIGQTGPILDCWDKSQLYLWPFLNLSCPSMETALGKYQSWSAYKNGLVQVLILLVGKLNPRTGRQVAQSHRKVRSRAGPRTPVS